MSERPPYEITVSVNIRSNNGYGNMGVHETIELRGDSFRDVAAVLERFHDLGSRIRAEVDQAHQADDCAVEERPIKYRVQEEDLDLDNRFTFHPATPGQTRLYEWIRRAGFLMADGINERCPNSREKAIAVSRIDEAVFWANAAIARHT